MRSLIPLNLRHQNSYAEDNQMKWFTVSDVARFSIVAAVALACGRQDITVPDPSLPIREGRANTPGYAVTELGTLPGDVESYAWAASSSGYIAVQSIYFSSTSPRSARWYVSANGQNTMLNNIIYGFSDGVTAYVTGILNGSTAAVWTFNPSSGFSSATTFDPPGAEARAVNSQGDITGSNGDAVIWKTGGTQIVIPNVDPSLYSLGTGMDINNTGDVAIQFWDNTAPQVHRGYLRTADGTMIELTPLAGQLSTLARGVSEIIDGKIYVAGTSDDRNGNYNAVRWIVDAASHAIIATQSLSDRSNSNGMADDGTIAGDLQTAGGSTGFVWKMDGTLTTLKTPKGSSSGSTRSISGNGKYVAGSARYGSYRKAVFWTAL